MKMLLAVFCMEHTCDVNNFIYRLRRLPLIKRLVSEKWYKRGRVKRFFSALTFIWALIWTFLCQILYVGAMIYLPASLLPGETEKNFIHIFFLLTLTGAYMNCEILDSDKEKYYAVNLMRADARKYALFSYAVFLARLFAGLLPAYLVFGQMAGLAVPVCLLLPAVVIFEKLCGTAAALKVYKKTNRIFQTDYAGRYLAVLFALLVLCYGLLGLGVCIPWQVQAGTGILAVPAAFFAGRYLWNSRIYNRLYRQRMKFENVVFNVQETVVKTQKENFEKKLDNGIVHTDKKGYEFFNEIFMKRHRMILMRPIKQVTWIAAVILLGLFIAVLLHSGIREGINGFMLNYLPYMVFIMYLINRGENISKAMFFNCDHSMLTYRFYRQPDAILQLFKIRLKTLIFMNLIPGSVIAAGLLVLYIASGGGEILNYFLIPCSILALSVFFSVHYLVLYYLFQPYNVQMETKTHTYGIAMSMTYILCYLFIRLKMSTLTFAVLLILFCVLYIAAALRLAYKRAPETFKLK